MLLRICIVISSIFCINTMLMAMELDSSAKYAACVAQYKALSHYLPHAPLLRHVAHMHLHKALKHNKNTSHKLTAVDLAAAATREPRVNVDQAKLTLLLANGDRVSLNAAHANLLYKHSQVLNDMRQDMGEVEQEELKLPDITSKEQSDLLIAYLSNAQIAHNKHEDYTAYDYKKDLSKYLRKCNLADICALAKTIEFLGIQGLDNIDVIVQTIAEMIADKLIQGTIVSGEEQSQICTLPVDIRRKIVRKVLELKVLELTGLYAALHADYNSKRTIPYTELQGHRNIVCSVSWSPDNKQIASACSDGTIRIWDTTTSTYVRILEGHTSGVSSVSWSPNGKHIVSGSSDKTIRVWNVQRGTCSTLKGHTDWVQSVAWSPNGKYIASCSEDKTVRIWNARVWYASTGNCLRVLNGHTNKVNSVAWSPDNRYIASCSEDNTIKVWETSTGTCIYTLKGHTDWVRSVAWSPNGKYIASGSEDKTIRVWDATTGNCIRTLTSHHTWRIQSVAWSPDGSMIASGSLDNTIEIWNTTTGACVHTLTGHTSYVKSVPWSPDGKYIASGSYDKTIRIWQWVDPAFDAELINEISLENILAIAKSKKLLRYLSHKL